MFTELQNKGYKEDESEFSTCVPTPAAPDTVTSGEITFVPRKPRFFNAIKQGYEWNKYNQVHYDADNPPPKVV